MTLAGSWPVQRPRWAGLLGIVLCVVGVSSLLGAGLPMLGGQPIVAFACLALAAAWGVCRIVQSHALAGTLSLRHDGLWELELPVTRKTMRLTHAWPAFAWITLQFHDIGSSGQQKPLELVVWKTEVSQRAWCELCVRVAGQVAMPGRILQKESL